MYQATLRVFVIVVSLTAVTVTSSFGAAFADVPATPLFKANNSNKKPSQSSATAVASAATSRINRQPAALTPVTTMGVNTRGGSATALKSSVTPMPSPPSTTPPSPKRVRIQSLDGIRALLATHIVLGHFLRYAQPPATLLRFFAQINVTVGAFFALSGYVTAYTSTEVQQREASSKLTGTTSVKWWLQKVMAFYPMHWLVLLLFSPMFIYSDTTYGGWGAATLNGLLSATLTQAWGPAGHAEVWVRIHRYCVCRVERPSSFIVCVF